MIMLMVYFMMLMVMLLMMIMIMIMMVSVIPYRHMANQYLRVKRSFGYTARVVVLLCLMLWFFQETLAIVFFAYVLSGPVGLINERARLQPGETEDF